MNAKIKPENHHSLTLKHFIFLLRVLLLLSMACQTTLFRFSTESAVPIHHESQD